MKHTSFSNKRQRALLVLVGFCALASNMASADMFLDRSGRFDGIISSSSSSSSSSSASSGCPPTVTNSSGVASPVLDASGKAVTGNMPEGTLVYDFGSKAMVFCNGTAMGAVGGSGGCRLCMNSCGGKWPVNAGAPQIFGGGDAGGWTNAMALGSGCTGSSAQFDDRHSGQTPQLCCGI